MTDLMNLSNKQTAFLWGGANVLPAALRGTTSNAFIHVCDCK